MKSHIIMLSLFVFILFSGCNDEDKFEFDLKKQNESDAVKLKVEFINDQIVHVTASPDKEIQKHKSLMIVDHDNSKTNVRVIESNNDIEITSDKLILKLNKELGIISYYDKKVIFS